jgi:hypothetical protein
MASSPDSSSGAEAKPRQQSQFAPATFLQDEARLAEFFATWEAGKLPKSEWTHAAHVAMAAWHAYEYGVDATFARMKAGIIRHNESVGTANTETSGYHETLTRFWAGEICAVIGAGNYGSRFEAVRAAVRKFAEERDRFRRFYSFDVVGDRRARREWIPPDRSASR